MSSYSAISHDIGGGEITQLLVISRSYTAGLWSQHRAGETVENGEEVGCSFRTILGLKRMKRRFDTSLACLSQTPAETSASV